MSSVMADFGETAEYETAEYGCGGVAGVLDDAAMARLLTEIEPGPRAMMLLDSIDVAALDVSARVDVAAAWERQQAWVAARAQAGLASVMADLPSRASQVVAEQEWRCDEVAAALGWSPSSAASRIDIAMRLASEFSDARALLEAGEISFRHAWVLADTTFGLLPSEAAEVQARVLPRAPRQTVAEFTRSVRRAVLRVAPRLAAVRHKQAVEERGVRRVARPDGMAAVIATLPAADAETVWLALDAVARREAANADAAARAAAANGGPVAAAAPTTGAVNAAVVRAALVAGGAEPHAEPQGIDAWRADALVAWANDALADPGLPRRQGRRVEVQVVVDLPTLLGMADEPAELIGYGPIPAEAARTLASDAAWRRLVVEPVTGHLLDFGATVYRPPQALADFIVARDRRCRFPGCGRRADACDIDHVCPYGVAGGKTAACNCCALCRRHHRAKTHGGWGLEIFSDGAVMWTSPHGRTFHVDAVGQTG